MKILGLGVPELVIILIVVLLIFGPKNLPKLGNAIGKGIKGLRDGMEKNMPEDEVEEEEVVEKKPVAKLESVETVEEATESAPKKKVVKKVVKK
ncbi:MAG: twin-arginine translocase TatA/TatE family subunit [Eggerthellaceae bacterium]|nr:twin-arginine translocase TatA/TatE family subunit [Eggerthellaceae bacterium]